MRPSSSSRICAGRPTPRPSASPDSVTMTRSMSSLTRLETVVLLSPVDFASCARESDPASAMRRATRLRLDLRTARWSARRAGGEFVVSGFTPGRHATGSSPFPRGGPVARRGPAQTPPRLRTHGERSNGTVSGHRRPCAHAGHPLPRERLRGRIKTSLGIWAFGSMVTRFMPVGYQPDLTNATTAEKVHRAVTGLGDLIDDYEFHYPNELAPANLDEVRSALDGHPIYAICAGLHLDPRFGRGGLVNPDPATRAEALRLTLEGAEFAGSLGAHFVLWPGIEGHNYPFP